MRSIIAGRGAMFALAAALASIDTAEPLAYRAEEDFGDRIASLDPIPRKTRTPGKRIRVAGEAYPYDSAKQRAKAARRAAKNQESDR